MNCQFLTLTRKNLGKDFSVEIDGDYELRCIKKKKTKQSKTKTKKKQKKPQKNQQVTKRRSEFLIHRNE